MIKKIIETAKESLVAKYQCCFCGDSIVDKALVLINLELGDDQQQSMAAHGLCLQSKLHSSFPFIAPEDLESGQ